MRKTMGAEDAKKIIEYYLTIKNGELHYRELTNNEYLGLYKIENCPKNIALSIKRTIDRELNKHGYFCELMYDSKNMIARFDIVT